MSHYLTNTKRYSHALKHYIVYTTNVPNIGTVLQVTVTDSSPLSSQNPSSLSGNCTANGASPARVTSLKYTQLMKSPAAGPTPSTHVSPWTASSPISYTMVKRLSPAALFR